MEWKRVVFSDEKKFNLDGPDVYSFYFHGLRKEELILLCEELPRLTAFATSTVFYYAFVRDDADIIITTILKCAPIISLGVFIYLKGFKFTEEYRYSHKIMAGLSFSCVGDLLLNIDLFPHGMAAFSVAQLIYINAFELQPLKLSIGLPLYVATVGTIAVIYSSLDIILKIGLPVYAFLLTTMCWRCIVRAIVNGGVIAYLCAFGSILFVISDSLISVSMFLTPIPNARIFIMSTYYVAQLFIAISTMSDVLKANKAKGSKELSRKFKAQD